MKKTPADIIILLICTKNYYQMMYDSWDIMCSGRMDRRTGRLIDGKSDIEVGAPPKKNTHDMLETKQNHITGHVSTNTES